MGTSGLCIRPIPSVGRGLRLALSRWNWRAPNVQHGKKPMNQMLHHDGWSMPSEEQVRRDVLRARRLFQKTLASWACDVLALRHDDLLIPRWVAQSDEEWQLAA